MSSNDIPFTTPKNKPPSNFNPLDASDDELAKYSFPPRPDKSAEKAYNHWHRIAKGNPEYFVAKLASRPKTGLAEARNWGGAVAVSTTTNTESKDPRFKDVKGVWEVPLIAPLSEGDGFKNGQYRLWTWVGIDGWVNKVALKIGVTSAIDVANGKVVENSDEAAILIRGEADTTIRVFAFEGFKVEPGHKLSGHIWATPGSSEGHGSLFNETTHQWVTASIKQSSPELRIEGLSAEWILSGQNPTPPANPTYLFPYFESTTFEDLVALREYGKETFGRDAQLFNPDDLPFFVTRAEPDGFRATYGVKKESHLPG